MAERATFTVDEVLEEIDELEDDSDDDFDGYIDSELDNDDSHEREDVESVDDIGGSIEIGSERTEVPEYGLTPGCSVPVDGNPLSFFCCFLQCPY